LLCNEALRHGVFACRAVDHDQGLQRRVLAGLRIEPRGKLGLRDRDYRARIRKVELQQVRRRQRVDQQRHEARAYRAEKRSRVGRRVVEEHQDTVAALQAQRLKAMPPLRSLGAEICVSARPAGAGQRQSLAAAVAEIVEQDAAGVIIFRNRKADLARARIVAGNQIGNL
jgi:hypothetical protein